MRKSDVKKIIDTYSEYKGEYLEKNTQEHKITFYNADNPLNTLILQEDKAYITVTHCEDGIYGNSDLWQIGKKEVKLIGVTTLEDKRKESAELRRYRMDYENMYCELAILKRKYADAEEIIKKSQNKKDTKKVTELKKENTELRRLLGESQNKKETVKVGRKKASERIDMTLFKKMIDDNVKVEDAMKQLGISRATYFRLKKEYLKD